jgi:hypothetical protein
MLPIGDVTAPGHLPGILSVMRSAIFLAAISASAEACSLFTALDDLDGAPTLDAGAPDADGGSVLPPDGGTGPGIDDASTVLEDGSDASTAGDGTVDHDRVVFLTSATYLGNFGGFLGADAKCQALADASLLPAVRGHTFRAWIGDGTIGPAGRLVHGTRPYKLPNNVVVAADWADLTDGMLAAPIALDENGQPAASGYVWTSANATGLPTGNYYCNSSAGSWTSSSGAIYAFYGGAGQTDPTWSRINTVACSTLAHLYCFEL